MANALITIKSLYESFPDTQRQLADYIAQHPDEVPFLSVHELAQLAGVSVATISRFARTIGYDSYKEFKTGLGKDSLAASDAFRRDLSGDQFFGLRRRRDREGLPREHQQFERHPENPRPQGIGSCGGDCLRADRVVFFGIGSSGHIAQDAALRFSHLDIQAEAYSDSYQILSRSFRMKKSSEVAVGISHSGRSTVTVQALRIARANGTMTIGISNYRKSPLHEASRVFFCTSFSESRLNAAALSSQIAQMCLIDALYLLVARHRHVSLAKIDRLNNYVERTLRLPGK